DGRRRRLPPRGDCGSKLRRIPTRPCPPTKEHSRHQRRPAPASAAASPSPVTELMPREGDAATTSWPCCRRLLTSLVPIKPVPPMMTIFIVLLLVSEVWFFTTEVGWSRFVFPGSC